MGSPVRRIAMPLLIALVIVVTSVTSATAARLLTGRDIKNGSLELRDLSAKARSALKGQRGPAGPQGTAGSSGVNGADGLPGQSGSTSPALLFSNAGLDAADPRFMAPGIGGGSASESGVPLPSGVSLTFRDLTVRTQNAPGGASSHTVVFRVNGVNTALTCAVTGANQTCSTASNVTVTVNGGDVMSIRTTPAGGPATGVMSVSLRAVT